VKSTDEVGFPRGLFCHVAKCRAWSTRCSRNTIPCARSFSLLPLPAPLSLCRLARKRLLKKQLPKLPKLLPKLLPKPLRKLLLLQPTLLLLLRAPLRKLLLLQPMLLLLQPTLLLLLRMLPRRCNLRRRHKIGGVGETSRPFSLSAVWLRMIEFKRSIKSPLHVASPLATMQA